MTSRVDELARAFDDDFARPIAPRDHAAIDLLAIRIGDAPYALARRELAGLFADKPVTALPGDVPGLVGLGGFRGALVPVYHLAVVLGAAAVGPPPRWLALAAGAQVALAFDRFERFLRLPHEAIAGHAGAAAGLAPRAARIAGEVHPLLDVPAIVEVIRMRVRGRRES